MNLPIGKIICGDCRKIMKDWILKNVVLITDPPYGIGYDKKPLRPGEKEKKMWEDDDNQYLKFSLALDCSVKVIFGIQNHPNLLPSKEGKWICWDKSRAGGRGYLGSDFELAWSNKRGYYRTYRVMHGGYINDDSYNLHKPRYHPTQKPIRLMAAIIRDFSKPGDIILDPFVGSGSTCIAAEREGRRWIGIEIDKKYCKIARKRVEIEKRRTKSLI